MGRAAAHGWDARGLARDALLNFHPKLMVVATFDLNALGVGQPGSWGSFHGTRRNPGRVDLQPGERSTAEHLDGLWFRLGEIGVPPRNLDEAIAALSRAPRRGLQQQLDRRRKVDVLERSGGVDLVLLCWNRGASRHVLVLGLDGSGSELQGFALLPGPTDEESLLLRAGPDAAALRDKRVALFGAGALGGHVALVLAESGVRRLTIVDGDVMLPGNVVRHVLGHQAVGAPKVLGVKAFVEDHPLGPRCERSSAAP